MRYVTLAIPIAFIVLAAVLLWCLIGSKGKWWGKLILIIAVPAFGIAVWKSLDSYLGWSTPERLPNKFILIWAEVREPDKKDPGAIYLWVQSYEPIDSKNPLDYKPENQEPRTYKLPYSRKWHEQLEAAKALLKKGRGVVFEMKGQGQGNIEGEEGKEGGDKGQEGRGDKSKEGKSGDSSLSQEQEYEFHELPPAKLPDKIMPK